MKAILTKRSSRILILLLSLLLTSCGFHLRQQFTPNTELNPMYVTFKQPYSEFNLILLQVLKQNGLTIVDSANDAKSHLRIVQARLSHNAVTRGPSNQAQVYNYRLNVTFEVLDDNQKALIKRSSITTNERLALRPNQLIYTNNQLNEVKRKLYSKMANLMLMKLRL